MIQPLDWDSRFFGFSVGKFQLDSPLANTCATARLAQDIESSGIELIYVFSSVRQPYLESLGFELLDGKVTYRKPINGQHRDEEAVPMTNDVQRYLGPASDQLLQLAAQSGQYSRFRRDPRLNIHCANLYREWVLNSLNREIADDVFIVPVDNRIGGVVTVRKKQDAGQIGLIAVDRHFQGQRLGSRLLYRAEGWYVENELSYAEVITQQFNVGACRFYARNGYQQESIAYIYHVWADALTRLRNAPAAADTGTSCFAP